VIGGLGVGAGRDVTGIGVGGLGVGAGGSMRGAFVGGLGVGAGRTLRGVGIGAVGVGAPDVRGAAIGGLLVVARDVRGALMTAGWARLEHGTLRGLSIASFDQLKGTQRGLAMGIVNYARELHGVQVGLINHVRNNPPGRRILPILNWGS